MAKDKLDVDLKGLPPDLRWREWMGRVEAVLFASASPVPGACLARVVGAEASVDLLIADIQADLLDRPYELTKVAEGWMMRTRPRFAEAIRMAADIGPQHLDLSAFDVTVLAAIAYHQPLTRAGLADILGQAVSRDLLARLRTQDLITMGPRSPQAGAPYTYVTTQTFLTVFGMKSLRDLPDREGLQDAGLTD